MTEELITALSGLDELTVIARTSVMQYKNSPKRVLDVGRELKTGTVIEGSVRKAANKVRITVQMVDARTEGHLWVQNYDRQMDDIFAIQTEIAEKVAAALKIRLIASTKSRLEKRPTDNTEAYMLYLKGRYYWNERSKSALEKGIAYLQKSLELDPNLALAYSDLADAYVVMADQGLMRASEAQAKVRKYARRALKLDPSLSQPHAAIAVIHERNFRWTEAENEFQLAIRLNPNNATAHHWYALHLSFKGHEKAMQEWRRAKDLDPLSLIIRAAFGYYLVWQGHREEGLAMARSAVEMNDEFCSGHQNLAFAYVIAGMNSDAAAEARKMVDLSSEPRYLFAAACAFAKAGVTGEAVTILNRLLKDRDTHYVDPAMLAMIYGALHDGTNALQWLDKAVREKSAGIVYALIFPVLDFLKDDQRFKEISKKIGLE